MSPISHPLLAWRIRAHAITGIDRPRLAMRTAKAFCWNSSIWWWYLHVTSFRPFACQKWNYLVKHYTDGLKVSLVFYLRNRKHVPCFYLNNRVFLSRNYRLIVAPRKFDVLKTNICPRSEASRANMLVLRTSNFQGATIRPIVPRHKHSIVFIVHH
jgi:hypothetical protein